MSVETLQGFAPAPLTAHDRCDRCQAQAYVRFTLMEDLELLFCAHHAQQHGDALKAQAVHVHDETEKLTAKPEPVLED